MKPVVALAEDDELLRESLREALEHDGWAVLTLEDGFELADYLELAAPKRPPAVVLTDVRMPGVDGLEVIERARQRGVTCPVVVMTSFPDASLAERAKRLGNTRLIAKPQELDELLAVVRSAR
ncbi:MAG: response regulator [Archangiaceae bacterium]|nr:response regulator [Archangiaceae bacterium]